jgi:cyclophilin family peptidyl-prolyl cis-trans isomerase
MGVKKVSLFAFLLASILLPVPSQAGYPQVLLQTSFGDITMELYNDNAPITVENFLQYVRTDFYDDLLFHRVVMGFVIQGGGYYIEGNYIYEQPTNPPIINESYNNLSNLRGTVAMARTSDPNSATSQFYVNLVDNVFLDREHAADGFGYCVFGNVISGMNVVDDIALTPVINIAGFTDFPYPTLVIINDANLITPGYWLNSDINNDGIANFRDYAYLAANWKKADSNLWGDLNQNNVVDANDLRLFSNGWLETTNWYKPVAEDINNDGIVNFDDFAILSAYWGMAGRRLAGDLNNDRLVDYLDLLLLTEHWLEDTSY